MDTIWAFLPVAVVFGVTPGPDVTLAMRSSLAHGAKHGVAVALGAATGSLVWGTAAAAGIATFVTTVPAAFEVLRWAGAIYLALLGVQSIRTAGKWVGPADAQSTKSNTPVARAFSTGLLADLLNPKMGVFYLAVIPPFIPDHGSVFAWSMALMGVELTVAVICLSTYAVLASSARNFLAKGGAGVWLERVLGLALIGFGVQVALS